MIPHWTMLDLHYPDPQVLTMAMAWHFWLPYFHFFVPIGKLFLISNILLHCIAVIALPYTFFYLGFVASCFFFFFSHDTSTAFNMLIQLVRYHWPASTVQLFIPLRSHRPHSFKLLGTSWLIFDDNIPRFLYDDPYTPYLLGMYHANLLLSTHCITLTFL